MSDFIPVMFAIGVVVVILAGIVGIDYAIDSWQCREQWADSGFHYRYGYVSGCMIQRQDGSWIPTKAYREISE